MTTHVTIQGVTMSIEAARNVEETRPDVAADVAAIRSAETTREALLANCLDGAEDDRIQGWHDYVDAVVLAAEA